MSNYPIAAITGAILAGGEGRRMGGVDKGLETLAGRPMASYVLTALRAQCATVVINANRNADRYAALGASVLPDRTDAFLGPLSGMASVMASVTTPMVLFAPCDSPLVAHDLGPRLWRDKQRHGAAIAVARDAERYHPVFALMDACLAASATAYLAAGERKIDRWFDQHEWVQVDCTDISESFLNVNRDAERAALEARLGHAGDGG